MILKYSDKIRVDYKGYMEPLLLAACEHEANNMGLSSRSKFIRYAVIKCLIEMKYPLNKYTNKFNKFYNKFNDLHKGMSYFI
jgi:hypothetical protein